MLIAEDLLLLLTDDASGKLRLPAPQVDLALAGANLIELALMNRVQLATNDDNHRSVRVVVLDPAPTHDRILDAALESLVAEPHQKPNAAVQTLAKNIRERLHGRLSERGILRPETNRTLGLFPRHTWPATNSHHEIDVRRTVTEALVGSAPPDAHTAALIALLHALHAEQEVVDIHASGISKEDVRTRAAEIAKGSWASEAVRKNIDAMLAAVMAATTGAVSTVVLPGAR